MRGTNPTWVLTIASLKMWFRDRQAIFWTFFLPLVLMLIFGILNFGDLGAVDLGVVDQAGNKSSHGLIRGLSELETFDLTTDGTEEAEQQALSDGDRDLVLVIPREFAQPGGRSLYSFFTTLGTPGRPKWASQ